MRYGRRYTVVLLWLLLAAAATDSGAARRASAAARAAEASWFRVFLPQVVAGGIDLKVSPILPGTTKAVAGSGTTVYLAQGTQLVTVDARDPAAPAIVWRSPTQGGLVQALAADGGRLYAGLASGELVALDLADPWRPRPAARRAMGAPVTVLALSGGTLVAGAGRELVVLDVAGAAAPVVLGRVPLGRPVEVLALDGARGYAGTARDQLAFDVTDPRAPIVRALPRLCPAWGCDALAMAGDWLLAEDAEFLRLYHLGDPFAPALVSHLMVNAGLAGSGGGRGLAVHDRTAVLVTEGRLFTVDFSDPARPRRLGSAWLDGAVGLIVSDSMAYVVGVNPALSSVDLSQPAEPRVLGRLPGLAPLLLAAPWDRFVAITTSNCPSCLQLLDAQLPGPALPSGSLQVDGAINRLAVRSPRAYLLGQHLTGGFRDSRTFYRLHVADLANPEAPHLLAACALDLGEATDYDDDLALGEEALAIVPGQRHVQLVRLPPAGCPRLAARVEGVAAGLALADRRLYVALHGGGLEVYDVADLDAPRLVGRFEGVGAARPDVAFPNAALALRYPWAYVAAGPAGLLAVDVVDPARPRLVSTLPLDGDAVTVAAVEGYVAVGLRGRSSRLALVDVRDPVRPRRVGDMNHFGPISALGNRFYVSAYDAGLLALDPPP